MEARPSEKMQTARPPFSVTVITQALQSTPGAGSPRVPGSDSWELPAPVKGTEETEQREAPTRHLLHSDHYRPGRLCGQRNGSKGTEALLPAPGTAGHTWWPSRARGQQGLPDPITQVL